MSVQLFISFINSVSVGYSLYNGIEWQCALDLYFMSLTSTMNKITVLYCNTDGLSALTASFTTKTNDLREP